MENNVPKSILEKLFEVKQYEIEKEIRKIESKELNNKLNHIQIEEIIDIIKDETEEKQKEIVEKIEKWIEDYEIKISFYSEIYYKEGIKDGMKLYNECIKK